MIKVDPGQYHKYIPWAERCTSNRVYPLSIAEGRQSGEIYADRPGNAELVLFWHCCGFAYLSGTVSDRVMEETASDICRRSERRMVLITDSAEAVRWLCEKQIETGKRVEYAYAGSGLAKAVSPGIGIDRIGEDNIDRITGRIVPAFSWEKERFLRGGFGYAAFDGGEYCGVAFSAAVSSDEVDIGVEVRPGYRGRGIATALVQTICSEILSQGKKPVWAHSAQNLGSMRTAEKCGFVQSKINDYFILKR